jgi:hypothetical protein
MTVIVCSRKPGHILGSAGAVLHYRPACLPGLPRRCDLPRVPAWRLGGTPT